MHYLYKITNLINKKVYIGQSINPDYRWYQHCSYSRNNNKQKQYIHKAIAKYGSENFIFEVIAGSKTQENADEIEIILISQYDSRNSYKGYNLKSGGSRGNHSEETKEKIRQATIKQIAEKGHPAAGRVVSQETRDLLRKKRLDNPIEYTDEIRKNMSEAHKGKVISEEQRKKMSEGIKKQWETRIDYSRKCEAPGCEVSGKVKYKIIDGVRYCNKHGLRILRYGRLNRLDC